MLMDGLKNPVKYLWAKGSISSCLKYAIVNCYLTNKIYTKFFMPINELFVYVIQDYDYILINISCRMFAGPWDFVKSHKGTVVLNTCILFIFIIYLFVYILYLCFLILFCFVHIFILTNPNPNPNI